MAAAAEFIPTTPPPVNQSRLLKFEFHGRALEFFKIWVVNLFLSIVTLGIFSAWAKVRTQRYLYGNTRLDGHSFTYLADPVTILKGRFIAFGFLIGYSLAWNFYPSAGMILLVVGVLLLPAILVAATRFKMRNSSYRNLRFGFDTQFSAAYRLFALPMFIILLLTGVCYGLLQLVDLDAMMVGFQELETDSDARQAVSLTAEQLIPTIFYLILVPFIPYLDYLRNHFLIDNSRYGHASAQLKCSVGSFYELYLMSFLVMTVAITIAITLSIGLVALVTALFSSVENPDSIGMVAGAISAFLIYSSLFLVSGYFRARRTNLIYGNSIFGDSELISELKFTQVSWILFSNTVAIMLSLGLLIPWSRMRMARYIASATQLKSTDLALITAGSHESQNALGDGMIDAFDLDIGL